ncbi:MAG: DUF5686 family protein, partial [Flavobacteriales bacterium]
MRARLLILFVLLMASPFVYGQKTIVFGRVSDSLTNKPVPFCTVVFKGTQSGTTTDIEGKYRMETYYSSDTLMTYSMGYKPGLVRVKQGVSTEVNFNLIPTSDEMGVLVFTSEEVNPAITIMKRVLRNKKINNREKLDAYEYEAYNKVEFDLNNITQALQDKKILKPFDFIFDGVDTTAEKPYLPVFMTESLSNFYFKRNPKTSKEVVKAAKVSGVENQSINQFLGDMYQNVNVYDNELIVFNKSFTSPIAAYCLGFYDYVLLDSAWVEGKWCYKLSFEPKRKSELLFKGEMWINDTTYAVKTIDATIAEGANINWIKEFTVHQEFNEVEEEVWMLTGDGLLVDFNLSDKKLGVYGRKTSSY